jgi:hypothetical protein
MVSNKYFEHSCKQESNFVVIPVAKPKAIL